MTESANAGDILALTTEIVAAHVSNNTVSVSDLPHLINQVYQSLSTIGSGATPVAERPQPAVSVKKSITPDYIICLEDGRGLVATFVESRYICPCASTCQLAQTYSVVTRFSAMNRTGLRQAGVRKGRIARQMAGARQRGRLVPSFRL